MGMAPPTKAPLPRRPVHGLLLLDKPVGFSSNQALQKVKWLLRAEKAGHTGTLDPFATGVLPLCFGAATKFSQIHLDADKGYEAVAQLGVTTSTGDPEGEVCATHPVPTLTTDALEAVRQAFLGPISQIPPMHSALKKDGKPLYEYARAGIEVQRAPRHVHVHDLRLTPLLEGQLRIEAQVSKGTYIRTLAQDIGQALGCGAHLIALRRTHTGPFALAQTVSLEKLEVMEDRDRLKLLNPVDSLLQGYDRVVLNNDDAGRFLSGVRRRGEWPASPTIAVYAQDGQLLGSAHAQGGELIPTRLLSPLEIQEMMHTDLKISPNL